MLCQPNATPQLDCPFRVVLPEQQQYLTNIFENFNTVHNEYNFATLLIWDTHALYRWCEIDGDFWLYAQKPDYLYSPLTRNFSVSKLKHSSDLFRSLGKSGIIYLVPSEVINTHRSELEKYFTIELDQANCDYVYETEALVELKGKLLQKKKNLVNQFLKTYPNHYARPLTSSDGELCLKLSKEWCRIKNCSEKDFGPECKAIQKSFEYFDRLNLKGIMLFVEDKPIAYSIYCRQNSNTVSVMFEKCLPDIKGAGQMINFETAKLIQADGYEFADRQQDLGLPGLRQAKQSYNPKFIYEVYKLIPNAKN